MFWQCAPEGWRQLMAWLNEQKIKRVHACLEATGRYSLGIALALSEAGYAVHDALYGRKAWRCPWKRYLGRRLDGADQRTGRFVKFIASNMKRPERIDARAARGASRCLPRSNNERRNLHGSGWVRLRPGRRRAFFVAIHAQGEALLPRAG
jgi:hypothetical protein